MEEKQKKTIVKKRAYTPPMLILYGKLSDLTGGGASGSTETGNPGQMMLQTTKRP